MDVKAWVFLELCSVFLQLVFFIPFYLIWRKDCKEEQLEAARMRTISALVSALKQVADLAGFEIVGRVVLMDKDSGRIFR